MESKRQHKYSRQIQKDLSDVLMKDQAHFFGNRLVSITGVEMSPDFSLAKIYFSVFPDNQAEIAIENLNDMKSEIRHLLGKSIGKRVRHVPELAFFPDHTQEEAGKISKLISTLDIPKEIPEE